jgi:hypothetical protein
MLVGYQSGIAGSRFFPCTRAADQVQGDSVLDVSFLLHCLLIESCGIPALKPAEALIDEYHQGIRYRSACSTFAPETQGAIIV